MSKDEARFCQMSVALSVSLSNTRAAILSAAAAIYSTHAVINSSHMYPQTIICNDISVIIIKGQEGNQ